jgi:hypothetical protein
MDLTVKNLFANLPAATSGERFATLFDNGATKIERIASYSHASPEGFWYDQADDEWVIVLHGSARLEFAAPCQAPGGADHRGNDLVGGAREINSRSRFEGSKVQSDHSVSSTPLNLELLNGC